MNTAQYRTESNNRNKKKRWFITFPQWGETPKQELLDTHKAMFAPDTIIEYVIARETHADGGIHYHMIVVLKNGINKQGLLKKYEAIYPNDYKRVDVGSVKNMRSAMEYLRKEDPTPLEDTQEAQREWERKENEARRALTGDEARLYFANVMLGDLIGRRIQLTPPRLINASREIGSNGSWQDFQKKLLEKWNEKYGERPETDETT